MALVSDPIFPPSFLELIPAANRSFPEINPTLILPIPYFKNSDCVLKHLKAIASKIKPMTEVGSDLNDAINLSVEKFLSRISVIIGFKLFAISSPKATLPKS